MENLDTIVEVRGERVSEGIFRQVRHWTALSSEWSMSSQVRSEQLEQEVVVLRGKDGQLCELSLSTGIGRGQVRQEEVIIGQ